MQKGVFLLMLGRLREYAARYFKPCSDTPAPDSDFTPALLCNLRYPCFHMRRFQYCDSKHFPGFFPDTLPFCRSITQHLWRRR